MKNVLESMDKWINQFKTCEGLLDPIAPDPEDAEIFYKRGDSEIVLHGAFTVKQLIELSEFMLQSKLEYLKTKEI